MTGKETVIFHMVIEIYKISANFHSSFTCFRAMFRSFKHPVWLALSVSWSFGCSLFVHCQTGIGQCTINLKLYIINLEIQQFLL